MADIIIQNISESDYSAILRQAVAVIDKSRAIVARSVCATIGAAHWELGKPIGVADYHLIIPQEELKRVVADEVEAFGNELPYRTKLPLLDSEQNNED